MSREIKAFTVWTCNRCGCKESTGASIDYSTTRVHNVALPPDWTMKNIDMVGQHFCPPCSDIIEKAFHP